MTYEDITIPFAQNGDRQDFPFSAQANNLVSWETGFTYLYELKPEETSEDPYILRRDFNEILNLITAKMLSDKSSLEDSVNLALDTKLDKAEYYADKPYFVTTNTTQSVSGQKTFTGNIYINNTPTASTMAVNKSYVDTELAKYVTLSTSQTISGLKTFSTTPRATKDPSNNNDLVRLSYLKNNALGFSGTWHNTTTQRATPKTNYTNTRGKPIFVALAILSGIRWNGYGGDFMVKINNNNIYSAGGVVTGGSGHGRAIIHNVLFPLMPNDVWQWNYQQNIAWFLVSCYEFY